MMYFFHKAAPKDMKYLMARLQRNGHKVELRNGGHYMIKHRDGVGMVTTSATPSDYRSFQNMKSQLRRSGFGDDL